MKIQHKLIVYILKRTKITEGKLLRFFFFLFIVVLLSL